MLALLRRRRRRRLRQQPVPEHWRQILQRRSSLFRRLPEADRAELLSCINVLLGEKSFEGCAGLELTEEMRVVIAGQAALLLLHRDTEYFSVLETILVYPESYVVNVQTPLQDTPPFELGGAEITIEESLDHVGESWQTGSLILSWSDVLRGAADRDQGCNVVLHEFAHQLDMENGEADGAPPIADAALRKRWRAVFEREYERLCDLADRGRRTFIDDYGSEHPSEFFAVATEHFFMEPVEFSRRHPELYRTLAEYYRQDPKTWGRRS
ncbi:MAG TPA: M90 family metallopeptidase [Candidatus Limnocylindrales bacterium]|nr:M90 family metallopeptidase [Candidatus Limnocylindrales bacterium]